MMIIVMLLFNFFTKAQQMNIPRYIPPSPDIAALGKFGNYSANHNTGALSLGIPIGEIKTPRFNLAITLDYVGGNGIKVDERASWVGLGWVLNVGGVISRTIVGRDDFSGFARFPVPTESQIGPAGAYPRYVEEALRDDRDTEPDLFFFSFNGRSGKFILDGSGNPILITNEPIKILRETDTSFKIIDENGDKYIFNVVGYGSSQTNTDEWGGQSVGGISAWYLTKMISADATDEITINYYRQSPPIYENIFSFTQLYGEKCEGSLSPSSPVGPILEPIDMAQTVRSYFPMWISSIEFNLGKVVFDMSHDRLDGGITVLNAINFFAKTDNLGGFERLKTFKFNYGYFYSAHTNPYYRYDDVKYRLRLDALEEFDKNLSNPKKHSFKYSDVQLPAIHSFAQDEWGYFNGAVSNQTLLQKKSFFTKFGILQVGSADRTPSPMNMEAGILKKITYPTGGYSTFEYEPNRFTLSERTPQPVGFYSIANGGMTPTNTVTFVCTGNFESSVSVEFRRIHDLTGLTNRPYVRLKNLTTGQVVYIRPADVYNDVNYTIPFNLSVGDTYELYAEAIGNSLAFARIAVNYVTFTNVALVKDGFGLRIKKISDFHSNEVLATQRSYGYGENEDGVGIVISDTFNRMPKSYTKGFYFGTYIPDIGCISCETQREVFFGESFFPLTTFNGSPLNYSEIVEYSGIDNNNMLKTKYRYDVAVDKSLPAPSGYPFSSLQLPYTWANGTLAEQTFYKISNNNQLRTKSIKYDYTDVLGPEGRGLKLGRKVYIGGCYLSPLPSRYFYYADYPIYTGRRLLTKIREIDYGDDGLAPIVETTTEKFYNASHQLTKTVLKGSDGQNLITESKYSTDLAGTPQDVNGVYQNMVQLNQLTPLIESKITRNNITASLTKTNHYQPFSNMFVPNSAEQLNLITGNNETLLNYHNYSSRGQVLSVSRDANSKTSYLWSYNNQFPIAEIKNVSYEDVKTALGGQSVIDDFSSRIPTDQQVNDFVQVLKGNPALKKSSITAYTYKPLVGMTSITDAKGMTIYYEYDDYGRLKLEKDRYGNIIKNYSYHYKP